MPYDHTSILKTILTRFCIDGSQTIASMGDRVDSANHLLSLLDADAPYEVDTDDLETLKRRASETPHVTARAETPILAVEAKLTDFQAEILAAQAAVMLAMGDRGSWARPYGPASGGELRRRMLVRRPRKSI